MNNLLVHGLQEPVDGVVNDGAADLQGDDVGPGCFLNDLLDPPHAHRVAAGVPHPVPNDDRGGIFYEIN